MNVELGDFTKYIRYLFDMDQAAAPASVMQSRDEPLRLEGPRTTRSGRTVKPPQYLENYVQAVYYV